MGPSWQGSPAMMTCFACALMSATRDSGSVTWVASSRMTMSKRYMCPMPLSGLHAGPCEGEVVVEV